MLLKIWESLLGILLACLILYGLFLVGQWLFDYVVSAVATFSWGDFTPITLVKISLGLVITPICLAILFAVAKVDVTGPMCLLMFSIPFCLIGLVASLLWFLLALLF